MNQSEDREEVQPGYITFVVSNFSGNPVEIFHSKKKHILPKETTERYNVSSDYLKNSNVEINGDEIMTSDIYSNLMDVMVTTSGNIVNRLVSKSGPYMESFRVEKYTGVWYQASRIPMPYEQGCEKAMANYILKNGYIEVNNTCLDENFQYIRSVKGKANFTKYKPCLNVVFGSQRSIFPCNYIILDTDYDNYAIVGSVDMTTAYILTRKKKVCKKDLECYKMKLETRGYKGLVDN